MIFASHLLIFISRQESGAEIVEERSMVIPLSFLECPFLRSGFWWPSTSFSQAFNLLYDPWITLLMDNRPYFCSSWSLLALHLHRIASTML